MKMMFKKTICVVIAAIILTTVFFCEATAEQTSDISTLSDKAVVLFTHDLHSHLTPEKNGESESGGYARLYTLLEEEREKADEAAVITVDGGDFSMGSLFQTIYTTDAVELRILSNLGVDVTTFGNHEFDYRLTGLTQMLNNAIASDSNLPYIVQANYRTPVLGDEKYSETSENARKALEDYGVTDYTIIEKSGVRFAVFGVLGLNAHEDSPMSGMIFTPIAEAAERVVNEIKQKEEYDYIICLSHSGTNENNSKSEDYQLAQTVDGIDIIVSAHTHTVLEQPIKVNDTYIVSCGSYCRYLGIAEIGRDSDGKTVLSRYDLRKVDENVESNKEIAEIIEGYSELVNKHYLSEYGFERNHVIGYSNFSFDENSYEHSNKNIGNIITDSYIWAVKNAEGKDYKPITIALNATGVIRGTLYKGDITVDNVFNVLSLGSGADGTAGYPLVEVYLNGDDIKAVCEVDASVSLLMPSAQIYTTGVNWTFNTARLLLNKVTEFYIFDDAGNKVVPDSEKLYRCVTGLYCCQMLTAAKSKSFGLINIIPKDKDGNEITNFDDHIIHDQNGMEVKEWYALASYVASFEKTNGISTIPDVYSVARIDKVEYTDYSPIEIFKQPNLISIIVFCVCAILVGIIAIIIITIVNKNKKKAKHQ